MSRIRRVNLERIMLDGPALKFFGSLPTARQVWMERIFEETRTGQKSIYQSTLWDNLFYVFFEPYVARISIKDDVGYVLSIRLHTGSSP